MISVDGDERLYGVFIFGKVFFADKTNAAFNIIIHFNGQKEVPLMVA